MQHIKELVDKIKSTQANKPTKFVTIFYRKVPNSGYRITEQDKKHLRLMATLDLARDRELLQLFLGHEFTEKFEYIKEDEKVIYTMTLKKRGERKEYADS